MSCLREGLPSPDPPLMWGWYTWGCRLENLGRPVRAGFLRCIAPNDLWSSTCPFAYWPRAQISNHEGPVLGPFSYTNVPFKICFQIQRKKPWSALQLTLRCVDTWTFLSYISWHFLWRATCNVQKMKMWVAKRIPPQKETRQTWILPHTIKPLPQTLNFICQVLHPTGQLGHFPYLGASSWMNLNFITPAHFYNPQLWVG
jgi:hypothetical protein